MSLGFENSRFSDDYKEQCFQAWFLRGCPGARSVDEWSPEGPEGRKPSVATITNWMEEKQWKLRAADLQAQALAKTNEDLVNSKAALLRKQMENAVLLGQKALDFLMSDEQGFKSDVAAVQAYFRAAKEVRETLGISEVMQRIGNMTKEEIEKQIGDYIERVGIEDTVSVEDEITEQTTSHK